MVFGFFGTNDEDRIEQERQERDAEAARVAQLAALDRELAGLVMRIAIGDKELAKVETAMAEAAPHWRTLHEAERDALLRNKERLEGRVDLVAVERKRFERTRSGKSR